MRGTTEVKTGRAVAGRRRIWKAAVEARIGLSHGFVPGDEAPLAVAPFEHPVSRNGRTIR